MKQLTTSFGCVESFETEALENELLAKVQEEPGPRPTKEQ
jgi:hypothetical protein